MRIVCPACDATYDVPDAMLAGGSRLVRCAKCSNEWTPTAISEAPLPPDDLDFETDADVASIPAPPPMADESPMGPDPLGRHEPRLNPLRPRGEARAEPAPPPPDLPPPRGGARAIVAWVASVLVLVALAGAAVAWRTQVMAAWPPSERVFAAIGLH